MSDFDTQPEPEDEDTEQIDHVPALKIPFDNYPPDEMVDGAYDRAQEVLNLFGPAMEVARQEGMTVVVLIGSYDPLSGVTVTTRASAGDTNAQIGLARRFIFDREQFDG